MKRNDQQVGIYRLFKLGRTSGNKFSAKHKDLETDLHPVHHDYADKINEDSEINGLQYEYDEEATTKYWNNEPYKDAPKKTKEEKPKKEKAETGEGSKEKKAEDTGEKAKATPLTKEEIEAEVLRLQGVYKDLTGEDAPPIWGINKLTEQIGIETEKANAKK